MVLAVTAGQGLSRRCLKVGSLEALRTCGDRSWRVQRHLHPRLVMEDATLARDCPIGGGVPVYREAPTGGGQRLLSVSLFHVEHSPWKDVLQATAPTTLGEGPGSSWVSGSLDRSRGMWEESLLHRKGPYLSCLFPDEISLMSGEGNNGEHRPRGTSPRVPRGTSVPVLPELQQRPSSPA